MSALLTLKGIMVGAARRIAEPHEALVSRTTAAIDRMTTLGLANTGDVVAELMRTGPATREQVHAALEELARGGRIELRPSAGGTFAGPNDHLAPPGPRDTILAYLRPIIVDKPVQAAPATATPPPAPAPPGARPNRSTRPVRCELCGETWPRDPALEVECPDCHKRVGAWCARPSGHRAMTLHAARERLAMERGFLHRCPGPATAAPARSALAQLLLDELVRDAQRSEYGVANTGRIVEHVRNQANKLTEDVHAALRELEAAGAIQLCAHAMLPVRWLERQLAPTDDAGRTLVSARPLLPYKAESGDPVVGYQIILTMEVDHPERRYSTLPVVEAGHRYDFTEFTENRAHAERRFDKLKAGRVTDGTSPDGGSEYAAEIAVSAVTARRRWAGWIRGPEPRARPEGSDR
jgi:hypothetical protein